MQRRRFLTLSTAGAAIAAATACTPVRVLLDSYDSSHKAGAMHARRMTVTFLQTILPFRDAGRDEMVEYLHNARYPIAKYLHVLCDALDRTATDLFRTPWLTLSSAQRAEVIRQIQRQGGIERQVLDGAILVAQATYYGGAWDDAHGCPAIDYHGTRDLENERRLTYPWASTLLDPTRTSFGNPS